jgi:hypothetical protein
MIAVNLAPKTNGVNEHSALGRTTPKCRVEFDKVWVRFSYSI